MHLADLARIAIAAALVASSTARAQDTSAPAATVVATSSLSVAFAGMESKQGSIMLALYDEAGWKGGRPVRVAMVDAAAADPSTVFAGLPAGRYGVKAFHDLNGNGTMDVNPFGMPTEPFAFSRDAHGQHGPAAWADAAFDVAAGTNAQRITIR